MNIFSYLKNLPTLLKEVARDLITYFKPTSRIGFIRLVILVLIIGAGAFFVLKGGAPVEEGEAVTNPMVTLREAGALGGGNTFEVIGTVAAVEEARLKTESGGRVTDVRVELGERVASGAILATIEGAAQHASLLQAEGAYEAAVAGAASTNEGTEGTRSDAVSAFRTSYVTVNDIVLNTIDDLFANPYATTPGLRVEGFSHTSFLNEERVAYSALLREWEQESLALDEGDDLAGALDRAQARVERTRAFVEIFLNILPRQSNASGAYTAEEIAAFQVAFVSAQETLYQTISALDTTRSALIQAEINATGGTSSIADAQVKQALGSLRQAQAAYEKTLVRSPITGTVNALYLKEGTYTTPGADAVVVANNGALEITTSISDEERMFVAVGASVAIEGNGTGTVTAIAPAVDPVSGKVQVKIELATETDDIKNGDTVRVSFTAAKTEKDDTLLIPLASLKVSPQGSAVFTVNGEGRLTPVTVTLGEVRGAFVEITDGIEASTRIVADARGLKAGEAVDITE